MIRLTRSTIMPDAGREPQPYDVWLMWVEYPDHPGIGKPRPVVITEVAGELVTGVAATLPVVRAGRG